MIIESQPSTFSTDIRRYIGLFWGWFWLIALLTILAASLTFVYYWNQSPIYQATSTLIVNEAPDTQAYDVSAVSVNLRLIQTYIEMMTKNPVLREVIANLELGISSGALRDKISVQQVGNTPLITVTVRDTDPQRAADIANELGAVFAQQNQVRQESRYATTKESLQLQLNKTQEQIDSVESALLQLSDAPEDQSERNRLDLILTQYRQTYADTLQSYEQVRLKEAETLSTVITVEMAEPSWGVVSPDITKNTVMGGVVGAMIAIGIIYLVDLFDDTIHGSDDISRILNLPVLGIVRKINGNPAVVTAVNPRSPDAEDFRSLRTNIQFASVDYNLRTLLITSATPKDGKSVIASNLSIVLAQGGQKISLIDADLRRPRIHEYMQIPNKWGLTYLFTAKDNRLDGVLRKNISMGLSVMTAGGLPPNPAELLGSEKMYHIIADVSDQSDVIVFDSPPLNAVTDASVLSKFIDGVILVVRAGTTKIVAAQQALEQLERVGANVIGVVLNHVDMKKARYGTYYSYYSDYSESTSRVKAHSREKKMNGPKPPVEGKKGLS